MPPSTAEQTYRYKVTLDDGRIFEVELDQEIPEGLAGMQLLQRLVHQQIIDREFDRRDFPIATAIGDVARGVVGGVRDIAQGLVDVPAGIVNTWAEFISHDPPGPPGTRRRLIPEVQAPQLPDLEPPQSGLESGVRLGTAVGGGVGLHALALPAARRVLGTAARKLFGPRRPPVPAVAKPPSIPRMWETPPAPPAPSVLDKPLSEGAQRIARRVLNMPWTPDQLQRMTPEQAFQALKRIRAQFPEYTAGTPPGTSMQSPSGRPPCTLRTT